MTPGSQTVGKYLAGLAEQLVQELKPVIAIKEVTKNADLLGDYVEAAVRRLIRRVVYPMHVSRGSVLDYPMPAELPQLDVIVWAPFPAPAIFEVEEFALVPRSSAFGVLEVKRSNYTDVDTKLEAFVNTGETLVAASGGLPADLATRAVLGVVPVLESKPSALLHDLIDTERVVAIIDKTSGQAEVRARDVLRMINVLHFITWRYRVRATALTYPQLITHP